MLHIMNHVSTQIKSLNHLSDKGAYSLNESSQILPKEKEPKPQKPLKIHSADIPYLKILRFYREKGKGKCYLKRRNWQEELVKFGGKAIHYQKQVERWAKMRELGYVIMNRPDGNRNKEYSHYITDKGLEAVNNFESRQSAKIKNGYSKPKKRLLETKKTVTPLNHVELEKKHVDVAFSKLEREDPEKAQTFIRLINFGFFLNEALDIMKKHSRAKIYAAWTYTNEKSPRNKGGYMRTMLTLL